MPGVAATTAGIAFTLGLSVVSRMMCPSIRGHLENGAVAHFRVTLKVGFRLESAEYNR